MKRRTSDLPILVYSYGCLSPTSNAQLVDEQLRLARRYRNQLIAIERKRRERYRDLMRTHGDIQQIESDVDELDARLNELREHIKGARNSARSRVAQPEASEQIKRVRAQLKELRAKGKEIRAAVRADPFIQAKLEALNDEVLEEIKSERAKCGVYWGTYLTVETAVEAARKSKTDPRFTRWNGEGRIAVQIQGGASFDDILHGRCQLLQIDPLPDGQWDTRSGRRSAKTTVRIRVQSDDKGKPIWATFPVLLHRQLPADGVVKNAWITRRYLARKECWQLQITVEAASIAKPKMPESAPIAAINFGWRVREDGLRVAMLVDETGYSEEFVLPQVIFDKLDHVDSLASIRDRNLDSFRLVLIEGLRRLRDDEQLPPWINPEDLKTMHLWKSPERFARFVSTWGRARTEGLELAGPQPIEPDKIMFAIAEQWRRQDFHLLLWQEHERSRVLGHRREIYRCIAATLANRYSLIVLGDFDLRRVARRASPEEDESLPPPIRRNRFRAAVGQFVALITQRNRTVKMPSHQITHTCSECGSLESFDAASEIVHTCSACQATWDQDRNASRNLLRLYRELPSDTSGGLIQSMP